MRQSLIVTSDAAGLPIAQVPCPCMWDLVEYLSYQRAAVAYHYFPSHFTVTFERMDLESAQRLLDEWAHAETLDLPTASKPEAVETLIKVHARVRELQTA
jgi:hypothetical protein